MKPSQSEQMRHAIAERAYFISEAQGFMPGCDMDNWLLAEAEITGDIAAHQALTGAAHDGAQARRKKAAPVKRTPSSTTTRRRNE